MSGNREVLYYRVEPVFQQAGMAIGTACVATCMATGDYLSGQGGGGDFLRKDIVDQLNMRKTGGKPRMILDTDHVNQLVQAGDLLLSIANSDELSCAERQTLQTLLDSCRSV